MQDRSPASLTRSLTTYLPRMMCLYIIGGDLTIKDAEMDQMTFSENTLIIIVFVSSFLLLLLVANFIADLIERRKRKKFKPQARRVERRGTVKRIYPK